MDAKVKVIMYNQAQATPEITPEILAMMKRTQVTFEEEANELSGLMDEEWRYRLQVIAVARKMLRLKHDTEAVELAIELMKEAIVAAEEAQEADAAAEKIDVQSAVTD